MKTLINYIIYFIEYLEELLLDKINLDNQATLFKLVFEELPTYDNIINRTAKLTLPFQLIQQLQYQKSPLVAPSGIEPLFPG